MVPYVEKGNISRHWSSSPRSRDRPWSRSPSRSVRGCDRAPDGAALYDKDVKKQAQQLGLKAGSSATAGCRSPGSGGLRHPPQTPEEGIAMSTRCKNARPAGRPSPRRRRRAGRGEPLPLLVLSSRRGHLLRVLRRADVLVVLLQPDPLGPLRHWSSSAWTTSSPFFQEPALVKGLKNTLIYAVVTCGLKVVLGMLLALLLTSQIIAGGYCARWSSSRCWSAPSASASPSSVLMDPSGLINNGLALVGIKGPAWLVDPKTALLSVALVDVWKGVGLATVIFIAGIVSIPHEYFEAAAVGRRLGVAAVLAHRPAAVPSRRSPP